MLLVIPVTRAKFKTSSSLMEIHLVIFTAISLGQKMLRRGNEFQILLVLLPILFRFESRQEVDKPQNAFCWPNEQLRALCPQSIQKKKERKRWEFKLLKVFSFSLVSFQFRRSSCDGQVAAGGTLWSVVNGFCETYETNYTQDGSTEVLPILSSLQLQLPDLCWPRQRHLFPGERGWIRKIRNLEAIF